MKILNSLYFENKPSSFAQKINLVLYDVGKNYPARRYAHGFANLSTVNVTGGEYPTWEATPTRIRGERRRHRLRSGIARSHFEKF